MKQQTVTVPDLGGAEDVEVIEVSVTVGAEVSIEQTLIIVESDKASMEIPAPQAGKVQSISVQTGQRVRQGDAILVLQTSSASDEPASTSAVAQVPTAATADQPTPPAADAQQVPLLIPDLGGADSVEVIEISVAVGATVAEGDGLLVLEGDKASMELPAPVAGTVIALDTQVGAQVRSGQQIGMLQSSGARAAPAQAAQEGTSTTASAAPPQPPAVSEPVAAGDAVTAITRVLEKEQRTSAARGVRNDARPGGVVYAGPAVRQLARELGVALAEVQGSGPKNRILKEDLQAWVKARIAAPVASAALPAVPDVDFSAFGPVETLALSNVQKATVTNMARSWLNVPHVTQFDFADVTELEAFRASLKPEMEQRANKLTPLPFLMMAVTRALREHPRFNSSLHRDGTQLVMKKYIHLGVAVDTPNGLVVPVIRDADKKSVWELAAESRELAEKARARKLRIADMQGACFTISSLGGIGGEGFTPIVNAPEVAILGVSKLALRPVWNGQEFLPRKTLPLSLSYDHRVINGADAGNFLTFLVALLSDIRRLLL